MRDSLVRAAAEEEAHEFERQQPDGLRLGREQLEDGLDAELEVEGGHHGGRVVGHQTNQCVQHILQVLVLTRGQNSEVRKVRHSGGEMILLPRHSRALREVRKGG